MPRKKGESVTIAFDAIRKMIVHYDLSPNDVLSDAELSKRLNMSRTPVREAIYKLMDFGLVERKGGRIVVKAITLTDIIEILQVREAIEIMSARIIIQNGGLTEEQMNDINALQTELRNCIEQNELNNNFYNDAKFHIMLVNFSNNSRLSEIVQKLDVQGERLRWLSSLTISRYNDTYVEHKEIINNLINCNYEKTAEAITSHINNTRNNYEQILMANKWDKILQTLTQLKNE